MAKPNTSKKVARNTLLLYVRMLLSMVISLYTSRVVLGSLGVVDFGVYNVVAGVVVMLGFLNHAMAASTQRFLTFEMGKNDFFQLKKVFNMSLTIHALIALFIFLLAESLGVWILNTFLRIPENRLSAANWVFQFSVFSFMVTVLTVPFNAAIISNERMKAFAMVGVLEVILKLLVVYFLLFISFDKLILYAILLFSVSLIISAIYIVYCSKNFKESNHYKFIWDKYLFKKMGSFAGWNLLGVSAGIGYNQGVNILLNIFFGPTVNAARAIAFQVQSAVSSFVTNFQVAVNPSITKSHAAGDNTSSFGLVFSASKFSFFLLLILSMPLLLETRLVLGWWLTTVPEYAVIFTRLVLIDVLVGTLSGSLQILAQATGNIRMYQFFVSGILLLNLPTSYLFLELGFSPEITMLISVFYSCLALVARLTILQGIVDFPVKDFFSQVVSRVTFVGALAFILPVVAYVGMSDSHLKFFIVVLVSIISVSLCVFFLGLNRNERQFLKENYLNVYKKLRFRA